MFLLRAAAVLFLCAPLPAQQQPVFEVASVKLDNGPFVPGVSSSAAGGPGTPDPGHFICRQYPLKYLITRAFGILPDQLTGAAWLDDTRAYAVTISATMPATTTKDQFNLMLQHLLEERFHLKVHRESKVFAGYELVVAPGGPKLQAWTPAANPSASVSPAEPDKQGFPRLREIETGVAFSMPTGGKTTILRSTHRQSMADFARGLGSDLNMAMGLPMGSSAPRVADKTGLPGIYEFTLAFEGSMVVAGVPPPETPDALDPGAGGPTLFNALENSSA